MDEIPDAEFEVVEHQIAPPLDPSPRWRFQRLARGTGSGLDDASYAELVNACCRKTCEVTRISKTSFFLVFSTIKFMFERSDLSSNFLKHGHACRH